jgi:hypothetical protein
MVNAVTHGNDRAFPWHPEAPSGDRGPASFDGLRHTQFGHRPSRHRETEHQSVSKRHRGGISVASCDHHAVCITLSLGNPQRPLADMR